MTDHDPITRKLDGEDHFALLGRDSLAPAMLRYYAALRLKDYDKALAIHHRLVNTARNRAPRPNDQEHAWSARGIADKMELWYRLNMTGEQPNNRVNTAPERDDTPPDRMRTDYSNLAPDDAGALGVQMQHEHLKNARPPAEPEEAS